MDSQNFALQGDILEILRRIERPSKAVVTAGMPYANGPLHVGHLAGAHLPADIYARWLKLLIGSDNVLFVCGTDDHGSNSEVTAKRQGRDIKAFIQEIHAGQAATLQKYGIDMDVYGGTSRPETFPDHRRYCQDFLGKLHRNRMLEKRAGEQWFDPEMELFLPDRFVSGRCPKCGQKAYSDQCEECGAAYNPRELQNPRSAVSQAVPVLRKTDHWHLNMWKVLDPLRDWLTSKKRAWRKGVLLEVMNNVHPSLVFSNKSEQLYKSLKTQLPPHKSRYAPGKTIVAQFENLERWQAGRDLFSANGVETRADDAWAYRAVTRDVAWGVPVELDPEMGPKTLYVWPESLIAPISFTRLALKNRGLDPESYRDYWRDPDAKVYQFLGQDNVFFYVLMQGAMWLGTQEDPLRLPKAGELQLTEIFSNHHLHVDGAKMSKSAGNFYTGDQLLEKYDPEQIRYFLALLSLPEKNSNLDFATLEERNQFLAGPMNAALEKPISAAHSRFNGVVPPGRLVGKTVRETKKIVQNYARLMPRAEYAKILFMIENYARVINGLFARYKPHDDRFDQNDRADALHSSFFILKNIMIMLSPFAPRTMERLRVSLNWPEHWSLEELAKPFPGGHKIGPQKTYF